MPTVTRYRALVKKMRDAAKSHPRSFVVLNGSNIQFFATARDAGKATPQIQEQNKKGHIPVIYKMPKKGTLVIL